MKKVNQEKLCVTLICARDIEELHKGDIVVAKAFVRALSDFANVSIICLSSINQKNHFIINNQKIKVFKIQYPQLLEIIKGVIKSLFTLRPFQYTLCSNKRVKMKTIKFLKELGCEVTISITSRAWAMHLGKVGKYNYVHLVDMLSSNFDSLANNQKRLIKKLFYKLEARRLKKDEEIIDKIATGVLQVAARNNELVKSNRIIIPITCSYEENFFSQEKKHSNEIVFLGTLSYWPNIDAIHWFVDKVFPIIRRSLPNTVFKIAGKGKVKLKSRIYSVSGVELVGSVSSAIDFLSRAAAVVVPIRKGTGMQNKILEAAWIGKEIICTSFAAEPFNAVCKNGIRIANSPNNFANEIIDVLKNPKGKNDMEVWARQIQRDYGYDALKRQLKNLLLNEYNLGG